MVSPPLQIEIRPNCSLSVRGAQAVFLSACAGPLSIAAFLALRGFWPVLPFAGLELLLLGWALKVSMERRHHQQRITVTEGEVSIESRRRGSCEQVVFPRIGRGCELRPAASLHPSRLVIESHGRHRERAASLRKKNGGGWLCGCNVLWGA
jgi:hypothetical protein